jgi:radical SAM protein with 4Fe4S-binding SPASM domain
LECRREPAPDDREFLARFRDKAARERIPLSGSFELTWRCNLRCAHCYVRGSADGRTAPELGTARVLSLIDEVARAGCLNLLFTGGEPLLRDDFPEIHEHAASRGILTTVFTNGTLIAEGIADRLAEVPPQAVEITILGAGASTHDHLTGVAGSFDRAFRGIRLLRDRGVRVNLKTVLMTPNRRELGAMRRLALDLGVPFRFDAELFPRLSDGDPAPLALRVPPEEAVREEMAEAARLAQWRAYHEDRKGLPDGGFVYGCGAGLTSFNLDPYGGLSPCLMTRHARFDVLERGFAACWSGDVAAFRARKAGKSSPCHACGIRTVCSACPAVSYLETGDEQGKSDYLCALAALRHGAVLGNAAHGDREGADDDTGEREAGGPAAPAALREASPQGH